MNQHFLTEVWATASLLKSPGLFSVFWPISIMVLFGLSPLVLLFPRTPFLVPILWELYQEQQLQLGTPSFSCSSVFLNSLARSRYLSFFSFSFNFSLWSAGIAKSTDYYSGMIPFKNSVLNGLAQSAEAVEYTDCTSAEGWDPPITSVLYVTLNNLMVRFHQCWSFGEYGVPLHCHRSRVYSDPEW